MRTVQRGVASLLVIVLAGSLAVLGIGVAAADPPVLETYADYSRIAERAAGQFVSHDGAPAQWAWRTDRPGQYSISWEEHEPESREHFIRSPDGNWLFLDGWSDNDTYYTQRVTEESVGDANCNNMHSIPSDGGRQHYVKWYVPTEGYCLDAKGIITEQSTGKTFQFRHRQAWLPPASCSNDYFADRVCISQREAWWDDNQHPWAQTLDREQYIAKGLGMAFKIRQTHPSPWSGTLRNAWTY